MPNRYSKTLKMSALTGIVTAVKPKTGEITVHHSHLRGSNNFTERDYLVKDKSALADVAEGDFVRATLLTDNADVWLLDEVTLVKKRVRRSA